MRPKLKVSRLKPSRQKFEVTQSAVAAALLLFFSVSAILSSAQSSSPDIYQSLHYRYIGPQGNRVETVAGVAGDENVIYAGAAAGGIFKTTDAGVHWSPIFDGQTVASIGALAVSRSDSNVVWAGTGEAFIRGNVSIGNGVYKSTDAGKTWTHTGLEQTGRISEIVIHPTD